MAKPLIMLIKGRLYRTEKLSNVYDFHTIKYMNLYFSVPDRIMGWVTVDMSQDVNYHTSEPFYHEGLERWVSVGHQFYIGVASVKATKVRKSCRQVAECPIKGETA